MRVNEVKQKPIGFKGVATNVASLLEEHVMLNKAVLDLSVDVPFVCLANNDTERKERLRRVSVNYGLCFLSPLLTLPLTNRLAMKHVAKLTPKFVSKESNLIWISNKYLKNKDMLKEGMEKLSEKTETDYSKIVEKCGGDYEKIRKKLINAKNAVLSTDFLFSTGSVVGMARLNNSLTKKATNMSGYSAEFELADKETVEKRAEKFKKGEPLRKGITAGLTAAVTALPLAIKKGLDSASEKGFAGFIKKHADEFDYTKQGRLMKRLPLFLFMTASQAGIGLASRNQTELKNNLLLSGTGIVLYFGGDILINSTLARISDKLFKTKIVDRSAPKTFINKLIPKTVPIKELSGKSKTMATINFFINMGILGSAYGFGLPKFMNKIVRSDLKKETNQPPQNKPIFSQHIRMDDFIRNVKEK